MDDRGYSDEAQHEIGFMGRRSKQICRVPCVVLPLSREMSGRFSGMFSERGTAAFLTLSIISEAPTRSQINLFVIFCTVKKAGVTDLTYAYVCTHIIWSQTRLITI
jgi:hypothetical protein